MDNAGNRVRGILVQPSGNAEYGLPLVNIRATHTTRLEEADDQVDSKLLCGCLTRPDESGNMMELFRMAVS